MIRLSRYFRYSCSIALLTCAALPGFATEKTITVSTPSEFSKIFTDTINRGNIDGLLSLYHDNALVVTDGTPHHGTARVRENLAGFMALGGTLSTEDQYVLEHGDIALVRVKWRITDKQDAQKVLATGQSIEVLQRQADGRWIYLIDHPFGAS